MEYSVERSAEVDDVFEALQAFAFSDKLMATLPWTDLVGYDEPILWLAIRIVRSPVVGNANAIVSYLEDQGQLATPDRKRYRNTWPED